MQYSGGDNLEAMAVATNYNHWLLGKVRAALPADAKQIVDFGAGNGYFARNIGQEVVCVEPAENLQEHLSGLKVIKSLADVADNSLDFIYSLNVLEHIEDDAAVLKQFASKLRPGGSVFIYVPAAPILYSSMDKLVGHCRRYRRSELAAKVTTAGLVVEACRYADFAGFFAALLFKYLPGQNGALNPLAVKIYDRLIFPLSRLADFMTKGRVIGKNLWLQAVKPKK